VGVIPAFTGSYVTYECKRIYIYYIYIYIWFFWRVRIIHTYVFKAYLRDLKLGNVHIYNHIWCAFTVLVDPNGITSFGLMHYFKRDIATVWPFIFLARLTACSSYNPR